MSEEKKPSIVIVYTDQQRYDTLGVNDNPMIRTPNLDAFAKKSVHFRRAYVTCPLCVPSRTSFFTGRYNHTNLSYNNQRFMLSREKDMAGVFKEAGYTTALIGKNHCYPATGHSDALSRLEKTFDVLRHAGHTGIAEPRTSEQADVNEVRKGKMYAPFAQDPVPPEHNITGTLFQEAEKYVAERAESDQPFFLWLSIPDPHPPYMVCEPYASMYDDIEIPPPVWREGETADKPARQRLVVDWNRYDQDYGESNIQRLRRIYYGMVSYIDDAFGRFLSRLEGLGLNDDTIVIFTSDHGDYMGDHRMIRKGPHVYEALAHVPLMIRWGDRLPARSVDGFAANVDIFPTLCALCGIEQPEDVQGIDLSPMLRGDQETCRDAVFLEHGNPGKPLQPEDLTADEASRLRESSGHHLCPEILRGRTKAVRTERWKYIYNAGDIDELYDLANDPDELYNLAQDEAYGSIVEDHRQRLLEWEVETEETRFV